MGNEPKDPTSDDPEPEPDERPTVVPEFDPAHRARETETKGSGRDPDGDRTLVRAKAKKEGGGAAGPDSAIPETTQMPDAMRSSLLSMADARVPSVKPQRLPSMTGLAVSNLDRGWEELNLEEPISNEPRTKPSPSDGPFRRETSRLSAKSAARAPVPEPPETPTREHPILPDDVPRDARRSIAAEAARRETPENTVFAPARAAAALTAPSNRPKAMSEPPPASAALTEPGLSPQETIREMKDRFSLGDYTGALVLADGLLDDDPNNVVVKECADNCRQVLRQMYTARIGPLDRVPVVTVAREQLRWLSIDHRAGFVLSHIDGVSSLEMILDVSGMPVLDALRILCELAQQRIISFR